MVKWHPDYSKSPIRTEISIDDFVKEYGIDISKSDSSGYFIDPSWANGHGTIHVRPQTNNWIRFADPTQKGSGVVSFIQAILYNELDPATRQNSSSIYKAVKLLKEHFPHVAAIDDQWVKQQYREHAKDAHSFNDTKPDFSRSPLSGSHFKQVLTSLQTQKPAEVETQDEAFDYQKGLASFKAPLSNDKQTAYDFMTKVRKISGDTIDFLMDPNKNPDHKALIRSTQRDAIIFPWYDSLSKDSLGSEVGASLQGTTINAKYDAKRKSEKRILKNSKSINGFSFDSKPGKPAHLVICESPIDAISYYDALKRTNSLPKENVRFVSMDGLKDKTVLAHIKANPQLKTVKLGVDRDDAGSNFIKKMQAKQTQALTTYASLNEHERKAYLNLWSDDNALIHAPLITDSRIPNQNKHIKDYNDFIKVGNLDKSGNWADFTAQKTFAKNLSHPPLQVFKSDTDKQQAIYDQATQLGLLMAKKSDLDIDSNTVGFIPKTDNANSILYDCLIQKFDQDDLAKSGLFYKNSQGQIASKLDNQILVPNYNNDKHVVTLASYTVDNFTHEHTGIEPDSKLINVIQRDAQLREQKAKLDQYFSNQPKIANKALRETANEKLNSIFTNQTKTPEDTVALLDRMTSVENASPLNALLSSKKSTFLATADEFQKMGVIIDEPFKPTMAMRTASFELVKQDGRMIPVNKANAETLKQLKNGSLKSTTKYYAKMTPVFDISQTSASDQLKSKLAHKAGTDFKIDSADKLQLVSDVVDKNYPDLKLKPLTNKRDIKTLTDNLGQVIDHNIDKYHKNTIVVNKTKYRIPQQVQELQSNLANLQTLNKLGINTTDKMTAYLGSWRSEGGKSFSEFSPSIKETLLNNVASLSNSLTKQIGKSANERLSEKAAGFVKSVSAEQLAVSNDKELDDVAKRLATFKQVTTKLEKAMTPSDKKGFIDVQYHATNKEKNAIAKHFKDNATKFNSKNDVFNSGTYQVTETTANSMPDSIYQPFDISEDLQASYYVKDDKCMKLPYVDSNSKIVTNKSFTNLAKDIANTGLCLGSHLEINDDHKSSNNIIAKSDLKANGDLKDNFFNTVRGSVNAAESSTIWNTVVLNSTLHNVNTLIGNPDKMHHIEDSTVSNTTIISPTMDGNIASSTIKHSNVSDTAIATDSDIESSNIKCVNLHQSQAKTSQHYNVVISQSSIEDSDYTVADQPIIKKNVKIYQNESIEPEKSNNKKTQKSSDQEETELD